MAEQQALDLQVPRVAKRSTSRVVRRPGQSMPTTDHAVTERFLTDMQHALDRAGVRAGEAFYVVRVPPPERRSHLGDLAGPPGSRAAQRRALLDVFAACTWRVVGLTAREACGLTAVEGGWRRVSELMQGGHLKPTGETHEDAPGHPARVLCITDRGLAALEATR